MTVDADDHIQTILDLSDQLVAISEAGFSCSDHDGCLLLNGIVRDCAFRLRDAAETEKEAHRARERSEAGQGVRLSATARRPATRGGGT